MRHRYRHFFLNPRGHYSNQQIWFYLLKIQVHVFYLVNMQKVISIRPTEEMERKLERLLGIEKMGRSAVIRKILDRGINEELKRYALELFKDKRVSLAKAAEIADISLRAMMDLIKEKDIPLHITIVDIRDDFEAAMR